MDSQCRGSRIENYSTAEEFNADFKNRTELRDGNRRRVVKSTGEAGKAFRNGEVKSREASSVDKSGELIDDVVSAFNVEDH